MFRMTNKPHVFGFIVAEPRRKSRHDVRSAATGLVPMEGTLVNYLPSVGIRRVERTCCIQPALGRNLIAPRLDRPRLSTGLMDT